MHVAKLRECKEYFRNRMHVQRMNLTNQFIEQIEKMEDNFKLYKVFQWVIHTKKDD
jgi:hypothetical protein